MSGDKLSKGIRFGLTGLAARAANFNQAKAQDGDTKPNRIALMLDCSGSMAGQSIDDLKNAVHGFVAACNFSDTAIAIATFPGGTSYDDGDGGCGSSGTPLMSGPGLVLMESDRLSAGGGTPMFGCLERVIKSIPLTRGVIVSDGDATDSDHSYEETTDKRLQPYIESKTPIDTVHIGDSSGGEETLKEIARLTGGVYLKFHDTSQFATAFKYLTPTYRGLLTSGQVKIGDS